jgi:hypothetical protein
MSRMITLELRKNVSRRRSQGLFELNAFVLLLFELFIVREHSCSNRT